MRIKFYTLFFIGIITLFSCEDVVDVEVPNAPPRLVIDANIERQFNEDGEFTGDFARVNLSLTTPFFSEEQRFVNEAEVSLTNMDTGIVFQFNNVDSRGNYQIFDPNFDLQFGVSYKLSVNYNNETYESTEQLTVSTPFTTITQVKNENDFDEDGVAVEIAFKDIEGEESFYFLDLGDNNFISIDDEFFTDGEEIRFTFFFDENVTLNHLFRISGSTKRFATYIDAINELGNRGANGPFETVPFQARGNIINITNSENFPFGYFRINEVHPKVVQLVNNQDFVEN